jgi:hypothetical protein
MTIFEKNHKIVNISFSNLFKDLETIALQIVNIKKQKADMEATGNYTASYIEEVISKAIADTTAPKVAGSIDLLEAETEDLKEAVINIIEASDTLENNKLALSLGVVGSLEGAHGTKAADYISRNFAGDFASLNLLAATSKNAYVKQAFASKSLDLDGIEETTDTIKAGIITLASMNNSHDLEGLSTRVYTLYKTLLADAPLFGVSVDPSGLPALSALYEAKTEDNIRKALGL